MNLQVCSMLMGCQVQEVTGGNCSMLVGCQAQATTGDSCSLLVGCQAQVNTGGSYNILCPTGSDSHSSQPGSGRLPSQQSLGLLLDQSALHMGSGHLASGHLGSRQLEAGQLGLSAQSPGQHRSQSGPYAPTAPSWSGSGSLPLGLS